MFGKDRSVIDTLNAMRNSSSDTFQNTVPVLSQENFKEYATGVLSRNEIMNEWANNLVNRIGLVVLQERAWENPLAFLKRGMLQMGDTVEEIFVDLVKAQKYVPYTNVADAGKIYASAIPPTYAVFHKVNREDVYEISFNDIELRKAFVAMDAMQRFIASIYSRLSKSDNRDEFLYMKQLLTQYGTKDLFYKVPVTAPTDEDTAKALIQKVKEYSTKFTFLSRKYNAFNVTNHADREEQIIFISAALDALVDVNVLASAFNMDKVQFMARRIILDEMPVENAHIILTTRDMFMIYDRLFTIRDLFNPMTLEWKYFYHRHQVMSTSRFENAVVFTSATVVVPDTIVVERATEEDILAGNRTQYVATVKKGTSATNVSQSVVWEVLGHNSVNTKIDGDGWLQVGLDETGTGIKVVAIALHYPEVNKALAVTLG